LRPTVVKVGGSFARYSRLDEIARELAKGAGRAVIVPGGGPFADTVRREQARVDFDDRSAHRMALLAMAAFGYALADRSPLLEPAASRSAIKRALKAERVPVWLPLDLLESRGDIPETWDMTSDSLAAWLAGTLRAPRLMYLKRAVSPPLGVRELVSTGILDPLAPRFMAQANTKAWLCGPRDIAHLGEALAQGTEIGGRIEVA